MGNLGPAPKKKFIRIRALGKSGVLSLATGEPIPLGVKSIGLMVFLAQRCPRSETRDRIVDLFWQDASPERGRSSLRQEIRRIRKAFGEKVFHSVFAITDERIGLIPGSVEHDVDELELAALSEIADQIAEILTLYRGDFLADNNARADNFQHWALERREFYGNTAISALNWLGKLDLAAGRHSRALRAADLITTIVPLHEPGHELMIRGYLAAGRRSQAKAHFERFRKLMQEELNAEPESSLAELFREEAPLSLRTPHVNREGQPILRVVDVSPSQSGEPGYLAPGILEQIVAHISKSSWVRVSALLDSDATPDDKADYVLRLDFRASGKKAVVTSTLGRTADRATVASDLFELEFDDVLGFQRHVALRIASTFEPAILDDQMMIEGDIRHGRPEALDRWRLLMRSRRLFWSTDLESATEVRQLLRLGVEQNPTDELAMCVLALSHMLDAWRGMKEDAAGSMRAAQAMARKAVEIAPEAGFTQHILGVSLTTPETIEEACTRLAHSVSLAPVMVSARGDTARALVFLGETAEGRKWADEALSLAPMQRLSALWHRSKAISWWLEGDLDQALSLVDHSVMMRPGWFQINLFNAAILAEAGRVEEAKRVATRNGPLSEPLSINALRINYPFKNPAHFERLIRALNLAGVPCDVPEQA